MEAQVKKVLVVEDDEDVATVLTKQLAMEAYAVTRVGSGLEALSCLCKKENEPHALILDLMLPGRSGVELLNAVKSMWPLTKIFIFSAHEEYAHLFPKGEIEGFFPKTKGVDKLLAALRHSLAP